MIIRINSSKPLKNSNSTLAFDLHILFAVFFCLYSPNRQRIFVIFIIRFGFF